jgi:hypothetical protein
VDAKIPDIYGSARQLRAIMLLREMSALIFFIFGSLGRFSSSAMATTIPDYFNIGVMFPMQINNIPVKSILNFAAM